MHFEYGDLYVRQEPTTLLTFTLKWLLLNLLCCDEGIDRLLHVRVDKLDVKFFLRVKDFDVD